MKNSSKKKNIFKLNERSKIYLQSRKEPVYFQTSKKRFQISQPFTLQMTTKRVICLCLRHCKYEYFETFPQTWLLSLDVYKQFSPKIFFQFLKFLNIFFMVEPLLSGIVLGLVPVTIAGLFVTAYLQYRRGDQATW